MADLHTKRHRSIPTGLGAGRAIVRIFLGAVVIWCAGTMAATGADLYRTKVTVTGQGEANRIVGFGVCLEDVLIKASGAQKLAGDRRLAAYKSKAKDLVRTFSYRDQFSGKPIRDEQGTRDRPYDLIVDFDEAKIDGLLATLGLKPWSSRRPGLGVFVEMEQGARQFIVTSDAKQSDLQRDSLSAAAAKRGMAIVLPEAAALAKANVSAEELMSMPSAKLAGITGGRGGEVALVGHLTWSDDDLGWITTWQMEFQGRLHKWQIRGVTFDEAFRRGLGGAAQVLSGNGDPE